MTEKGRISEINGNTVTVVPEKSVSCFGCMNQECKSGGGYITAENSNALPLTRGQTVEVRAPGVSVFGQAMAALLPPIFGFFASFFIARLLFPNAADGVYGAIGIIFLFATAFLVYRIRKKFPPGKAYTVTRIIG